MEQQQQEQSRQQKVEQVIEWLCERFPACFSHKQPKPLALGIFDDISQAIADDPTISKTLLRQALRRYTQRTSYLRCVKVGAERVNLQGEAVEVIAADHVEHAQELLAKRTPAPKKPRGPRPVDVSRLTIGQRIDVQLANNTNSVTVKQIEKDAVIVALDNGLTMTVKAEHLRLPQPKKRPNKQK